MDKDPRYERLRFTTGVPGLDEVLGGGPFAGSSVLVLGPPGGGKTILASQIAFHRARLGEVTVFVTMIAESHERLVANISSLSFFDAAHLPDRCYLVSGYTELKANGAAGFLAFLRRIVRDHQASLLVIDGLTFVKELIGPELAVQSFLYDLAAMASLAECTTLLTMTGGHDQSAPECSLVDVVIELDDRRVGVRDVRGLSIKKSRGSDALRGVHAFEIDADGARVQPRLEARAGHRTGPPLEQEARRSSGVPGLDDMMGGGLRAGSTTAIAGSPGSGKTTLGLSFLAAAAGAGDRALYFGCYEAPDRLVNNAARVGLDLQPLVDRGDLAIVWQPPFEGTYDAFADRLLEEVDRRAVTRLFVDGLDGFRQASAFPERTSAFFAALTNELRTRAVTTVFSQELAVFSPEIVLPIDGVSAIIENLIVLRYVEWHARLVRLLSVVKVRESAHESALREITISARGVAVGPPFASAEQLLTGRPRTAPPRARRGCRE